MTDISPPKLLLSNSSLFQQMVIHSAIHLATNGGISHFWFFSFFRSLYLIVDSIKTLTTSHHLCYQSPKHRYVHLDHCHYLLTKLPVFTLPPNSHFHRAGQVNLLKHNSHVTPLLQTWEWLHLTQKNNRQPYPSPPGSPRPPCLALETSLTSFHLHSSQSNHIGLAASWIQACSCLRAFIPPVPSA